MNFSGRSEADVTSVVVHAKLDPKDLNGPGQVLHFDSELLDLNLVKFLEVDHDLADLLSRNDGRLVFRSANGKDDESNVFLCTDDRTFEIKEAETSNSLLLVKDLSTNPSDSELCARNVVGVTHRYIEMRACRPKTSVVQDRMAEHIIACRADFQLVREAAKGQTIESLLEVVNCSRLELEAALRDLEAVAIPTASGNVSYALLENHYQLSILKLILQFIEENSWTKNSIESKDATVEAISEIEPAVLVESVFDQYMIKNCDGATFSMDENKICRFYGENLLQVGSAFQLSEFLEAWRQVCPEDVSPSIAQLRGLMLVDTTQIPEVIRYFPEKNLPDNIQERFESLFSVKSKWTLDEIEPFISGMTTASLDVNAILTKYARAFKVDGVKFFSSKYGK